MDKKLVKLLKKVESDLERLKIRISNLEELINDSIEAKRSFIAPNALFKIKHFKNGDLN